MSQTLLEQFGYDLVLGDDYKPNNEDTCRVCKWSMEDWMADSPLTAIICGKPVNRGFCVHPDIMDFIDLDATTLETECEGFSDRRWE